MSGVDIETEWNLKYFFNDGSPKSAFVDIETEWNLKAVAIFPAFLPIRRYRNRVEFKDRNKVCYVVGRIVDIETEWNLKEERRGSGGKRRSVDIETEWNLKFYSTSYSITTLAVDIETEWNLK